jgi:Cu(I)/Ag(I) efflux system membrane protein CusA/SilA
MSAKDETNGSPNTDGSEDTAVSSVYKTLIAFPIRYKVIVFALFAFLISWGLYVAPFQLDLPVERSPVPVDAIPNIGENQQIVFTKFPGGSPQDVEDQVSYPLSTALQGIPKVKEIRSRSMTGFSIIYVVFEEDAGFYWSRSRIAEKLASLPEGTLPDGVSPSLGPDATALGQIFWYTLEGRDKDGEPAGGWNLQEKRTVQDFYVRYALASADGVSEVASIGGYKKEYQVQVNPDMLRARDVTLGQVEKAVREASEETGAGTVEITGVEYLVRGIGFVENKDDIAESVVAYRDGAPIRVKDVGRVIEGPADRRGLLSRGGTEAVGGVAIAREGSNPRQVIESVKAEIEKIEKGLPSKTLEDGTKSQLQIVPFYDRTDLINRTVGTLGTTLYQQVLVVILVVLLMMLHMRSSILISMLLPIAVLMAFIAMKYTGVEANVVALAGIAIAIGTMVDLAIVMTENIVQHLNRLGTTSGPGPGGSGEQLAATGDGADSSPGEQLADETDGGDASGGPDASKQPGQSSRRPTSGEPLAAIKCGAAEVAPAILTAISVTIISISPIFFLTGQEGRMFGPLAHTMTYALAASLIVSMAAIPPLAYVMMGIEIERESLRRGLKWALLPLGIAAGLLLTWWIGLLIILLGIAHLVETYARRAARRRVEAGIDAVLGDRFPAQAEKLKAWWADHGVRGVIQGVIAIVTVLAVASLLTVNWLPVGPQAGWWANFGFVGLVLLVVLGGFWLFRLGYEQILRTILEHKAIFALIPTALVITGISAWLGFGTLFANLPASMLNSSVGQDLKETFPGLEREFMPALDEGSFLYMPVTMPHGSLGEAERLAKQADMIFEQIPEVSESIGKIGRADTPLDPAPIGMLETVVHYKPEYKENAQGRRIRFAVDEDGDFKRDEDGELIRDPDGLPYRNWRDHIETPDDIWQEMVDATEGIPGLTSASKLQPIETRILMLQSGIRAPVAVRLQGTDLEKMGDTAVEIEQLIKDHPMVNPGTVNASRPVGKPYLEIVPDRKALARWGITMEAFQSVVRTAIGGKVVGRTIEGRERYNLRIRYPRELRNDPDAIGNVLIANKTGEHIPLKRVADIEFRRGPQGIRSEDGYLTTYVMFASADDYGQIETVDAVRESIQKAIDRGEISLPKGTSFDFAGQYKQAKRAEKRLTLLIPLVVMAMFLFVYLRFGRMSTAVYVFLGVTVAFSGGFLLMWAVGQPWFMDLSVFGANLREIFQMKSYNLSIAVWVGFLALLGIAAQDGIVMATYLQQRFDAAPTESISEIRERTVEAGLRRVRPCLMTTATTILALLPVLTSYGTGSGVMIPMALPIVGGMAIALITLFVVPTAYCLTAELKHKLQEAE